MNKFYITTPIYYVNDKPHIGHAYTTVAADVLARWHRQAGERVFFLTGTDEHGAKVAQAAAKAGQEPQDFCDGKAEDFKNAWQLLNIQYDNFIRTTDPAHEAVVSKVAQTLYDKGLVYKGEYEGLYCTGCEQYKISDDLINGKCSEHQIEPILLKEKSYFFKLSQFQNILKEKIVSGELQIEPAERKNEVLSFIDSGLRDISISRKNITWGIPLPFDKNFTLYVWVDAFLNYLTGLGWDGEKIPPRLAIALAKRANPPFIKGGARGDFWPPDVQLMSKDILRVHATIWTSLLLALEIPLPKKMFVHGFFTLAGQKISKSLGNIIWPEELVEKFGVDGSRYLLMSLLSCGQDSDISWEKLVEKYNADLANGLGNLVSRVVQLSEKLEVKSEKLQFKIKNLDKLLSELKFKEALEVVWQQVAWANKYIEETKLWELIKSDSEKGKKILSELLALISEIAGALAPFMPEASERIKNILIQNEVKEVLFARVK